MFFSSNFSCLDVATVGFNMVRLCQASEIQGEGTKELRLFSSK